MRKIILIFLFILFFAGLATLVFGFYNAGNIRHFAVSAEALNAKYDGALRLKEVEKNYQKSGTRDVLQLKVESENFISKLDEMAASAESATREIDQLNIPLTEMGIKKEMKDYYTKAGTQIRDAKNISEFRKQIFEVAVIFGKIKEDVALDEMKNLIAEAKQENAKVDASRLPKNLRENGQALNDAMDKFLVEMENVAGGSIENPDQLNEAYAEFSAKEDEFSVNSRGFINSLEDLKPLQDKIRADLAGIEKIYFKIK
ncbi:MAG: hypothetical protein Q8L09_03635 [Candidatus Moranbacteria bacterium]|nr:hypothetical protein [Candidatus Moranbacteria bacterium]